jgi:hypothetical protein
VPTKPDRGYVWIALLWFYGLGLLLLTRGLLDGSLGLAVVGGLLVFGGVYYSVRWHRAVRNNRDKKSSR